MKSIVTLCCSLLLIGGCAASNGGNEHEQKLSWVEDANPQQDAQAALQRNDFRLIGLPQRSLSIPGVTRDKMQSYEIKCGERLIDGFSDVVRSNEHLRLMKAVHQYALQYNAVIKQRCIP